MRATGNRAIVSAGWAGLGASGVPEDLTGSVYILTSASLFHGKLAMRW